MEISENPKNKKLPRNMSLAEKHYYIATGHVTVGRFSRMTDGDFIDFYLPRIRSINILKSRGYKHPGYKAPDQAYSAGVLIHKDIQIRAAQSLTLEL